MRTINDGRTLSILRGRFAAIVWLTMGLSTSHTLCAQSPILRVRIVEDLRLDAEKNGFSTVSKILIGPRLQLIVPVKEEQRFAFFDSTGKRFGSVGGKGAGPGEFNSVLNTTFGWKADTLWVQDHWQRRVSYFTADAKLIRTVALPSVGDVRGISGKEKLGRSSWPIGLLFLGADGSSIGTWARTSRGIPERILGLEHYLIRIAPSSSAQALVALPLVPDERIWMEAGSMNAPVPFTMSPQIAASATGDRIATLVSHYAPRDVGSYTVTVFKANGDPIFARTITYQGIPVTKAAKDSAVKALEQTREGGSQVVQKFQEIARARMPSFYSEAESIVVGLDNTVWIGQRRSSTGQEVLVLDNAGKSIATILVPPNSRLRQASRTHVWMTEKDAYDLTSIVRYRVVGLSCAGPTC